MTSRRGTEAVITAPTRNRMGASSSHAGSNPALSATLFTRFSVLIMQLHRFFVVIWLVVSLSAFAAESLDYIVAVVNDEVIVNSELQAEVRQITERLTKQNIALPSRAELDKQVLDHMILQRLQLQIAKNTGIIIDDNSLNEGLQKIATQNKMDLAQFQQEVAKEGYTVEQFRENIRRDMTIARLQQRQVASRINVTEKEIDNFIANQTQQGDSVEEYHLLHILIATSDVATPEQIEAKQHQADETVAQLKSGANFQQTALRVSEGQQAIEGGDLGWRKAGEIPSLFAEVVTKMKAGEVAGPFRNPSGFHIVKLAEKRNSRKSIVNQTQMRHILLEINELATDADVQTRLQRLKTQIENGADFEKLAQANSADKTYAAKGGLLGWVSPDEIAPELEEVMNKLPVNKVSEPFKSRYGWHIMQVLGRRKHDNTEQAVRSNATQQIRQRKTEEELQAWLRQIRDEAYVESHLK
jgi:peptidyl-prolyl cis-trans isomerase SurA